jgi:hypothetical protein
MVNEHRRERAAIVASAFVRVQMMSVSRLPVAVDGNQIVIGSAALHIGVARAM